MKTPSPIVCEVLGRSDLDALCLDAEHAPFGRNELDICISATRAAGTAPLVRVPTANAPDILNALDCGAAGVIVPHVKSRQDAENVCIWSQYGPGGRGFAGSTRAAGFGEKSIADHLQESADQTTIIVQIEDVEALDAIDDIASVSRIDCLFIGRIDLTVAMGKTDPSDPSVIEAVNMICAACQKAGKAVGMYVANGEEAKQWMKKGASVFLLSSDQAFLTAGARDLVDTLR